MRSTHSRALVFILGLALALAGCGGSHHAAARPSAQASAETVIRSWSNALRRGDVRAAAQFFALPSEFADGLTASGQLAVVSIHSIADAVDVNSGLTCGSVFISAYQDGRYLNALFRLTNRTGAGADCGAGVGQLARVDFLIKRGRIVEWIRAPQAPAGGGPAPTPTVPEPTSQV